MKTIWKIVIGFFLVLILFAAGVFTYGYFHYGKLIKSFIIESVAKESKGLYHVSIRQLNLNVIEGNLIIKDLELIPDTVLYHQIVNQDSLSPMLFSLKIDRFIIKNFRVMDALKNQKIDISGIRLIAPDITVFRMNASRHATEDKPEHKLLSIPLPAGWNSISIDEIAIKKGRIDYYDLTGDSLIHQAIPSCEIMIKKFLVDSVHQGKKRLFNADDISIKLDSISFKTKNGLNVISLGEIGLSTGMNQIYIKNFRLIPQHNRYDYTRKLGYQTDRMDIRVGLIRLQRLNLRELILNKRLIAGLLEIDSLIADNYRDKRVPLKPGFHPPMPQDAVRNLNMYLKIDTVSLSNGKAVYAEQLNKEAGTIFFDKINATLSGLTNDSILLQAGLVSELKGTAYLMGVGKLDAMIGINFGDKNNLFTFSASVGAFDLTEINPMLTKLLPAEIKSGKVKRLIIPKVVADDDLARGKLLFYYNNLSVSMKSEKVSTWNSIKKNVINFVANDILINNDNPPKSGKMKTGIIFFRRDKEKGIINFLWKSTLSGLKSTMGFNSKEQKAIKKAGKK